MNIPSVTITTSNRILFQRFRFQNKRETIIPCIKIKEAPITTIQIEPKNLPNTLTRIPTGIKAMSRIRVGLLFIFWIICLRSDSGKLSYSTRAIQPVIIIIAPVTVIVPISRPPLIHSLPRLYSIETLSLEL